MSLLISPLDPDTTLSEPILELLESSGFPLTISTCIPPNESWQMVGMHKPVGGSNSVKHCILSQCHQILDHTVIVGQLMIKQHTERSIMTGQMIEQHGKTINEDRSLLLNSWKHLRVEGPFRTYDLVSATEGICYDILLKQKDVVLLGPA